MKAFGDKTWRLHRKDNIMMALRMVSLHDLHNDYLHESLKTDKDNSGLFWYAHEREQAKRNWKVS